MDVVISHRLSTGDGKYRDDSILHSSSPCGLTDTRLESSCVVIFSILACRGGSVLDLQRRIGFIDSIHFSIILTL